MKNLITYSIIALFTVGCYNSEKEVGFIDVVKVFNDFNLSIELKEATQKTSDSYQQSLAGLQLELKKFSNSESEEFRNMAYRYEAMAKEQQIEIERLVEESDEKIWKLLNSYFKDFGQKQGIPVLLGGTGNGSILYTDDRYDYTQQFIDFANRKYEGE